ncbi:phospho-N-acetylmuramoyl-pentapeptide-transferase [Gammaproteobacteria bacterium]|nr:phospho-N-acetylmuramoyl-pentapeptide-transferase [Gammaproteobacteria bacterium]
MLLSFFEFLSQFNSGFNAFQYLTLRIVMGALTALIISLILGPYIISYLKNKQFYQSIREDGPQSHLDDKNTTPTMGGIIIISSVVISTILWSDLSNSYILTLLFGILGFGAIGFYDDYKKLIKRNSDGIKGRLKLFLQIIFASIITIFLYLFMDTGSIQSVSPFLKDNSFYLGILFIPWAIFILVGSSNAVNLTDGLDGLAILPCILIASAFVIFSYVHGNVNISDYLLIPYIEGTGEIAIFAASLVGAGLGFLWFNSYPAEIFMGDCGSLSLGSSLGLLAIILKQELAFAIMSGIFVAEALSVIIQVASFKLRKGKRVFKMAPLHHHYELSGLSEPKIIMRFWIITFILVLIALSTLKIR